MTPTDCTVDLYLRADAAGAAAREQERVRDRVLSLDTVATTSVTEWTDDVSLGRRPGTAATSALAEVTDWARRTGVRLHPSVGVRTCCTSDDGERYRALTLPVVTLVVREGATPRGVFPHRDGDEFRTVGDALDALESGRAPVPVEPAREPAVAD